MTNEDYPIEIAEHNSAGIREIAAKAGATHMRKIASGSMGEPATYATLYAMPCNEGEIRVLDTNGDPVWEDEDATAFAETLEAYGIEA